MSNFDLTTIYLLVDLSREAAELARSECDRQLLMLYDQRLTLTANREKRGKRELKQSAELTALYKSLGIPPLAVA